MRSKVGIFGDKEKFELVERHLSWICGFNKFNIKCDDPNLIYYVDTSGYLSSMSFDEFKKIFECEPYNINEWDNLWKKFGELHKDIVNKVIKFAEENKINIDEFALTADGINPKYYEFGWCPTVDSSFTIMKNRIPFICSM